MRISSIEKIYFILLIVPFFIWSFLGGHKQIIYGLSSDHVVTAVAFVASAGLIFSRALKNRVYGFLLFFYVLYILSCILSLIFNDVESSSIYVLLTGVVYLFITISFSIFFEEKEDLFIDLIIFSSLFSAISMIISFAFLGMGEWGRVTIPVFYEGSFLYFPNGYESSSDPNVVAYFLGFGFITAIFFRDRVWRYSWIVILVGIGLTLSRSALLSVFIVLIFNSLFFVKKISINRLIITVAIFLILFFLSFSLIDFSFFYNALLNRLNNESSNSDRIERFAHVFEIISDPVKFVFGNGVGFSRDNVDPHNFYLSTLQDTGFFSLIFILLIVFVLSFGLLKELRNSYLKRYVFSLVAFFCIISFFYWQVRTYYFLLLILIVLNKRCFVKQI